MNLNGDYISDELLNRYTAYDINIVSDNIFHTKMMVKHLALDNYLFDADSGKFVDCNENAVRFFKLTRAQLMRLGPADVSATEQPVGGEAGQPVLEQQHGGARPGELQAGIQRIPLERRLVDGMQDAHRIPLRS